jgi:hypothetical protein
VQLVELFLVSSFWYSINCAVSCISWCIIGANCCQLIPGVNCGWLSKVDMWIIKMSVSDENEIVLSFRQTKPTLHEEINKADCSGAKNCPNFCFLLCRSNMLNLMDGCVCCFFHRCFRFPLDGPQKNGSSTVASLTTCQ